MAIALHLQLIMDEQGKLQITGIPNSEPERKIVLSVLGQAVRTVAMLKPHDPNALIVPDHLKGQLGPG